MPNSFAVLAARAVAVQVVNESGYLTFTVATPSASVFTSGNQRTVERKSLRTWTGGCWPGGGASCITAPGAIAYKPFTLRAFAGSSVTLLRETIESATPDGIPRPTPNSA